MLISKSDKIILQDMAKRQLEIANSEKMFKIKEDWQKHGNFDKNSRPMIMMELWTFAQDIIPPLLKCEGEKAREIEWGLHYNVANHNLFDDDTVVKDFIPFNHDSSFIPFGIEEKVEHTDDSLGNTSLGHNFVPVLQDLEEDFYKLGKSKFKASKEKTAAKMAESDELFGDILPAKLFGSSIGVSMTQNIIHIMKMEDMFTSMYDYPELFHKMMDMLTNDYIEYFRLLEKENILLPTVENCHLSQGSYSYTNELPASGNNLKTTDVWGYMDSQETSGVSAEMFKEFIAPYYDKIASNYGLFSYGCCEAVDGIWNNWLSQVNNLRKVSISPWCNEEFMGQALKNKNIVYMRKPSPNLIGVGVDLDVEAATAHIAKTVENAQGCFLEFIQRDVYKINNTPDKVKKYVEIIRKCSEKHKI